jgi:hypothetical protein
MNSYVATAAGATELSGCRVNELYACFLSGLGWSLPCPLSPRTEGSRAIWPSLHRLQPVHFASRDPRLKR